MFWKLSVGGRECRVYAEHILWGCCVVGRCPESCQLIGFTQSRSCEAVFVWSLSWKLSVIWRECRVYTEQTLWGCCSVGCCPWSCQLVGENAGFMQSWSCEAVVVLVIVLEVVSWWERVQALCRTDPVKLLWCWLLPLNGKSCQFVGESRVYAELILWGGCGVVAVLEVVTK